MGKCKTCWNAYKEMQENMKRALEPREILERMKDCKLSQRPDGEEKSRIPLQGAGNEAGDDQAD